MANLLFDDYPWHPNLTNNTKLKENTFHFIPCLLGEFTLSIDYPYPVAKLLELN